MGTGNYEMVGYAGFGLGQNANVAGRTPAAPRQPQPYEDPERWGAGVAPVVTSFADLARAIRGESSPSEEPVTDYGVPAVEESFFSSPAGYITIAGVVAVVGTIAYFALKKKPAAEAKKANRRRRRRNGRSGAAWYLVVQDDLPQGHRPVLGVYGAALRDQAEAKASQLQAAYKAPIRTIWVRRVRRPRVGETI